jgi:hypothetical protein
MIPAGKWVVKSTILAGASRQRRAPWATAFLMMVDALHTSAGSSPGFPNFPWSNGRMF